MDVSKLEEIKQYLQEAVPTQNIHIERPDITNTDFKFDHEITGNSHVVRFSHEFIDDHDPDELKIVLREWKLSEHIDRAVEESVNVTNEGITIGEI